MPQDSHVIAVTLTVSADAVGHEKYMTRVADDPTQVASALFVVFVLVSASNPPFKGPFPPSHRKGNLYALVAFKKRKGYSRYRVLEKPRAQSND